MKRSGGKGKTAKAKKPTKKSGDLFGGIKRVDLNDTIKVHGCMAYDCSGTHLGFGGSTTCTTAMSYTC